MTVTALVLVFSLCAKVCDLAYYMEGGDFIAFIRRIIFEFEGVSFVLLREICECLLEVVIKLP